MGKSVLDELLERRCLFTERIDLSWCFFCHGSYSHTATNDCNSEGHLELSVLSISVRFLKVLEARVEFLLNV
jgi:hypothetical protein